MTNWKQWVEAAARLAERLHIGQRDKARVDYFSGHLTAVARQGRTWLEQILGYLHDSTEDTSHTAAEVLTLLEQESGSPLPYVIKQELATALNLLNHHNALDRFTYIEGIASSPLATRVKLNDLRHNMEISRIMDHREADYQRLERYRKEYEYLLAYDVKPILYIDMDNVLVNFESGIDFLDEATKAAYAGRLDEVPGIFALMEPMSGAIEAVLRLSRIYEVYILSTAPWLNPSAWSDKLLWVQKYFGREEGSPFYKRLILSHHKELNQGAILIDDRMKNGVEHFQGQHLHFGTEDCPDWRSVLNLLNLN